MIKTITIILKKGTSKTQIDSIIAEGKRAGLETHAVVGGGLTAIVCTGEEPNPDLFATLEAVDRIIF